MRLAAWIALLGLTGALFGRYVAHDWRVTVIGGSICVLAICAWIINIKDAWNGDK